jgi:hypothetical protein
VVAPTALPRPGSMNGIRACPNSLGTNRARPATPARLFPYFEFQKERE